MSRSVIVELDENILEDLRRMKHYEVDGSFASHVAYDLVDLMIAQHPEEMEDWIKDED